MNSVYSLEAEADNFLKQEKWSCGIATYNRLIQLNHKKKERLIFYYLDRSKCFINLQKYEAGFSDWRRVLELLKILYNDGLSCLSEEQIKESLDLWNKIVEAEFMIQELKTSQNHENSPKLLESLYGALKDSLKEDGLLRGKNTYECKYCDFHCDAICELQAHFESAEHQVTVMSDEGRKWYWRPPPRGFTSELYQECDDSNCYMGSNCMKAHGAAELIEWKARLEYRQSKLMSAFEKGDFRKSYRELLLQKCAIPNSGIVLYDSLSGVKVEHSNLNARILKEEMFYWTFKVSSEKQLRCVCLLHDTHRDYFKFEEIAKSKDGDKLNLDLTCDQEYVGLDCSELDIRIKFESNVYGTFRQSLILDFGSNELLVKDLCADVVPTKEDEVTDELNQEITTIKSTCWTENNSEIIEFATTDLRFCSGDDFQKRLLELYPYRHTCSVSHSTAKEKSVSASNYGRFLHDLLYVEEVARNCQVDKYSFNAKLHIVKSYLLSSSSVGCSIAKYSHFGELYACVYLNQVLSEDTSGGRLILTNCSSVLLNFNNEEECLAKPIIYEAMIEDRGKNAIYLRLSSKTVSDLKLIDDTIMQVQIQFRLNRVSYCEWHYAVDSLKNIDLLFPAIENKPVIPWSPQKQWSESMDYRLNAKQKEAVIAITCPLKIVLPPILIIGPFGTGKTYTMAQAIKQLLQQENTQILICTHSNSAADLYVKDYLDPYVREGHEEAKPLRIYYMKRWVSTVHPTVQKYCLIEESNGERNFVTPTFEDIKKHRIIVVTLSTSIYLSLTGIPNSYFTHILIDEAAQTMECDSIMPLSLAGQNTRIVLAGDHMQLSPEIFSTFAKDRNLHISLLERLHNLYDNQSCKIHLRENYRSNEAIVEFTSESFYNERLYSSGKKKKHPIYHPLTFFTVLGEDLQDVTSTSFYNNSEVFEIVERVIALKKDWPVSVWGDFDENSIGIMTPYADQVFRIRSELRKRFLKNITVERVTNAQGKQFRVVILSTVRTRYTCKSDDDLDSDYGFLSNLKLLNTAITRSQSLVAVVGDPVALCSIGLCGKVWEKYIQTCAQNDSLFGIEWKSVKLQLDGLELKKIYGLNPLAPEFIPAPAQKYVTLPIVVCPSVQQHPIQSGLVNLRNPVPVPIPVPVPNVFGRVTPRMQFQAPPYPYLIFPNYITPPFGQNLNYIVNQQMPSNMVQLMDNVHLPISGNDSLHDLVNLLPDNTSLADMLLQSKVYQSNWYQFLLRYRGAQAAKKFEYLLLTSVKKPVIVNLPRTTSANNINSHGVRNNVVPPPSENMNWSDAPADQLNVDRPVYLQRQQQTLFNDPINPNFFSLNKESVPLYKRKSSRNNSDSD